MGAEISVANHPFLQKDDVDWDGYVKASWRSERAGLLDYSGGLARSPILLGQSFSARMEFLGEALQNQADRMEEIINPNPVKASDRLKKPPAVNYYLNTDRRAAERRGEVLPANDPDWGMRNGNVLSNAEYQRLRKVAGAGIRKATASVVTKAAPKVPPAEWRKRVHTARRNVFLMVQTMIRLKRGHNHPRRFHRFADLSFLIPQSLAEDCGRFIQEQRKYSDVRQAIGAARSELDEHLRAAAAEDLRPAMSRGGGGTGLPPLASRGGSGGDRPSGGMRHVTFGAGGAAAPAAGGTRQFTSAGGAGEARSASAEREARRATVHDLTEGPIRSNNSGPLAGGGGGGYGYGALINRPRLGGGAGDLALAAAASATASPPRRPVLAGPGGRQGSMPRLQRNSLGEEPSDMVSPIRKQLVQGGPGSGPLVQRQASMPVGQRTAGARAVAAAAAAAVAAADGQEGSTYGGLLPNIRRNSHGQAYDPAALLGSPLRGNMDPHAHQQQQLAQQAPAADRQTRMVQLRDELERQYEALKRCNKLLNMYVNKVNGSWAAAQQWGAPEVTGVHEVASWTRGDQFNIYKADLLRKLRLGQVAIQIHAADDSIAVPQHGSSGASGRTVIMHQDIWTADLWEVVDSCRPGIMPPTDRIEGLSAGGRVLSQLALSVEALAGKEAVGRLHVVLHVNEEQAEDVAEELHRHHSYGLNRENLIVVVAHKHRGYRFDPVEASFVPESGLAAAASGASGASLLASVLAAAPSLASLGSGHALCQLAWAAEAFTVGAAGEQVPLDSPVLERLEEKKIEWMLSRRSRDMVLLHKDGIFDVPSLAYALFLRDRARATAVLEVVHTGSAVVARQHDSVVLQHTSKSSTPNWDTRMVAELRQAELVAPRIIDTVEGIRTAAGGKGLAVGLGRYMLHVPTIKAALTSLSVLRPRLSLTKELLNVCLDHTDMLSHERARSIAVEARVVPGTLSSSQSLDALIPLLQAQDHDPAFRDIVLRCAPEEGETGEQEGPQIVSGNKGNKKPGMPIIVFVTNNKVSSQAVGVAANLARAGRDTIHITTFAATEMQRADGEALLAQHKRAAMRAMTEVRAECVVRGMYGLLESMERYVNQVASQHEAKPLVVMGSVQLTSNVFNYVVGSITLSAIKRLAGTPVVVVTANSKQVPAKPGMRVLALAEGHSRALMTLLCTSVVDQPRGDRLLLGQVAPSSLLTRQQQANYRRLAEQFQSMAHMYQTPVAKTLMGEGPMDKVLCELVEENGVGLLAVQLPPGTKSMPQQMLALLRSCKGATLIHQDVAVRQSMMLRKSGALRKSINMLNVLRNARQALAAGEAMQRGLM